MSGTVVTIVWKTVPQLKQVIYELIPAFLVSTVLIVVVSAFTRPPPEAEKELADIEPRYRFRRGSRQS